MKGYTTIDTDPRYADYADIGCGEAAMAALGIPVDCYMIGLGKVMKCTGSAMMLAGKLLHLGGKVMDDGFSEELAKDKKKIDTFLYMRK